MDWISFFIGFGAGACFGIWITAATRRGFDVSHPCGSATTRACWPRHGTNPPPTHAKPSAPPNPPPLRSAHVIVMQHVSSGKRLDVQPPPPMEDETYTPGLWRMKDRDDE